ncbi:MAG: isoaspartyl peptidase/L-asparaginase [candidate division NC10 bacterium]|nr:isoaspartyl peptidase/L-asparaginase [candidate division NC10 bacterium]
MIRASIIVHGGAGKYSEDLRTPREQGAKVAALEAWRILAKGGSAVDAVETAVAVLEDDPVFNAGRGAVLNADCQVELDASIMDGRTLRVGAVGAVKHLRNPVRLARRIMEQGRHVLLVGAGAERFAAAAGIPTCPSEELITERQLQRWWQERRADLEAMGTVGAVAFDQQGHVAAATSTGGMAQKHPGRVGDSALIGCGTYAEDGRGAVSCTGHGEPIIRVTLARATVDRLEAGLDPMRAAQEAIADLARKVKGEGGLILVDGQGRIGCAHNTPAMTAATVDAATGIPRLLP